jgi:hypothetical protein
MDESLLSMCLFLQDSKVLPGFFKHRRLQTAAKFQVSSNTIGSKLLPGFSSNTAPALNFFQFLFNTTLAPNCFQVSSSSTMIQMDIGGHPPFPTHSKQFSGNFGNLLFLAGFNFQGHFEGLNEGFSGSSFSMIPTA